MFSIKTLLSGATPYLLAGSLALGIGSGFFLGSVWYGNKYKGEITKLVEVKAELQKKYDGFKQGALTRALDQNHKVNDLEMQLNKASRDLAEERNKRRRDVKKKSDELKDVLANEKNPSPLSDAAIDYFKRLQSLQQGR